MVKDGTEKIHQHDHRELTRGRNSEEYTASLLKLQSWFALRSLVLPANRIGGWRHHYPAVPLPPGYYPPPGAAAAARKCGDV
eukprot:3164013-Amphidinium_carterae.2